MSRVRLAVVLAGLAVLAVLATTALAITTYVRDDHPAEPLAVTDRATGARFEVPAEGWQVRGPRSRIYYEDDTEQPTAVVTGPAVFRDGYCAEEPGDSNRGFAGFTDQTFESWQASLSRHPATERRDRIALAGGSTATLRWVRLPGGTGPCAGAGVELAMVDAGEVRVVLVADTGGRGTLAHDEIARILATLRPPR